MMIVMTVFYLQQTNNMQPERIKATWLWQTEQIQEQPKDLLAELKRQQMTTLFLQVNQELPHSTYQTFIREATAEGFAVHALDGAPDWIVAGSGEKERAAFFDWLASYQKEVAEDERFKGIHLDVEPYLHALWNDEREEAIEAYKEVIGEGQKIAEGLHLFYGIDIPFWFDRHLVANEQADKRLAEWLIDQSDQVTIMAYRDKAEGENGVRSLIEHELDYAASVDKQVLIGIETKESMEGDHLSFYGKSEEDMYQELLLIERTLKDQASFGGFAIHSLD